MTATGHVVMAWSPCAGIPAFTAASRLFLVVSSRDIWHRGVLLACGAPLAGGVVIVRGLSFEVAVFGAGCAQRPDAESFEPGAVVADPVAGRVIGEVPSGV